MNKPNMSSRILNHWGFSFEPYFYRNRGQKNGIHFQIKFSFGLFVNIHVLWHVVYANDDANKCGSISLIASDAHFVWCAMCCNVWQLNHQFLCKLLESIVHYWSAFDHCVHVEQWLYFCFHALNRLIALICSLFSTELNGSDWKLSFYKYYMYDGQRLICTIRYYWRTMSVDLTSWQTINNRVFCSLSDVVGAVVALYASITGNFIWHIICL